MDELSERRTARRVPAPASLPAPTGQVPVVMPTGPEPVQPYLPPVAVKPARPVTGQVASILVIETLGTTVAAPKGRKGRRRLSRR